MVSILVANVYVNNLEECPLRESLLPCLNNSRFSKRLDAASIEFDFNKIQFKSANFA